MIRRLCCSGSARLLSYLQVLSDMDEEKRAPTIGVHRLKGLATLPLCVCTVLCCCISSCRLQPMVITVWGMSCQEVDQSDRL
jgi:hypothetical protein